MTGHDNELKGTTFTLSVLHIHDAKLEGLQQRLANKREQAPDFFNFAPLVLNVSQLDNIPDFNQLKRIIAAENFFLVGITGVENNQMKEAAHTAGLAVMSSRTQNHSDASCAAPQPNKESAVVDVAPTTATKVHVGPVRSGQQVYATGGSLVILGSVSPGAEVLADESIHVYGTLRGRAIAGARGSHDGRIYCQQLEAELLSIAGIFQLRDTIPSHLIQQPVHVQLDDNEQLLVELIKK